LSAVLLLAVGGLDGTPLFDPPQKLKQVTRLDAVDGAAANPGEHIAFQAPDDLLRVAAGPG
jgi:hypothetical protein